MGSIRDNDNGDVPDVDQPNINNKDEQPPTPVAEDDPDPADLAA